MGDVYDNGAIDPSMGSTAAFTVARELLERAEADARSLRAEADRFVHQREREAEMLLAKARRVLVAAEERAAVIVATARERAADDVIDLTLLEDVEIGRVIAPGAARLHSGRDSRLDHLLASAITHAVDDAFPAEASA
jgi:hypothetical protein